MTTPTPAVEPMELFRSNRPLARWWANKFTRGCPWLADDFTSAGDFALWSAACDFDPERGIPFSGLANSRIRHACLDVLTLERERLQRRGPHRSIEALDFEFVEDAGHAPGHDLAVAEEVQKAMAKLPPDRRELLVRRIGQGEPLDDLAADLGVSRQAIQQRVAKAIDAVRAELGV